MKVEYILDKTDQVNPLSREKMFLELNYDQEAVIEQLEPHVGIRNMRFGREDVQKIYSKAQGGMTGGVGIFEGVPLDIKMTRAGIIEIVKLYIDLTDNYQRSKDGAEFSIKMYQSLDWLNDRIDGFTFDSLFNADGDDYDTPAKTAMRAKFIFIPYVLNTVPNYREAFMSLLTASIIGLQVVKEITVLVKNIVDLATVGASLSIPQVINLAIQVAYIIALFGALIMLLADFVLYIIQPIKYHAAMLVKDLLEITCTKLGLAFQSSKWNSYPYNRFAIIPEHYSLPTNISEMKSVSKTISIVAEVVIAFGLIVTFLGAGIILVVIGILTGTLQNLADTLANFATVSFIAKIQGFYSPAVALSADTRGYPQGTGGDLLRAEKLIINGKILIKGTTLIAERRDFNLSAVNYQLADVRSDCNGYNTKEFHASTVLKFRHDLNDKNTIDQYKGTAYEETQVPKIINDPALVLTKGLREIEIPFARGMNKTELSVPEQLLDAMIQVLDKVTGFLNTVINDIITIVNNIVDFFTDLIQFVTDTINQALAFVVDAVNTVIAGIISVLNDTFDLISLVFNTLINEIVSVVNDALGILTGLINDVIDIINSFMPWGIGHITPPTINIVADISITHIDPELFVIPAIVISTDVVNVLFVAVATIFGLGPGLFVSLFIVLVPKISAITIPSIADLIGNQNRINCLMLENDMIDTPKLVMIGAIEENRVARLDSNNLKYVNAEWLWSENYAIDSFVPVASGPDAGKHNQFILHSPSLNTASEKNRIPFSFKDFEKVKDDNKVLNPDGSTSLIDTLQWHFEESWADMDLRKNEQYTDNLKLIKSTPNGN